MLRFASLLIVLAACLLRPLAAQERQWTDTQGRTMRAQFLREADGDAVFLKDGRILAVPLERFSDEDREIMRKLAAGKPLSEQDAADDPFAPVTPGSTPPPREPPPAAGGNFGPAPSLVKQKLSVVSRDWSDVAGNRTSGKFVRVVGREVLVLRGARTIILRFDDLSFADQAYVNQVLEDRGQPLMANPAGPEGEPLGGPSQRVPDEIFDPGRSNAAFEGSGPVAIGHSQFFQDVHRRQEETRQSQAEFATTQVEDGSNPSETAGQPSMAAAPVAGAAVTTTTVAAAAPATEVRTAPKQHGGIMIDGKTLAELRPVLIVGLFVIGLFAAVSVIVFIATSIAASNSARRQRRYL